MSEKPKGYNPTEEAAAFARWEASLQPGERSREDYEHEQRRKAQHLREQAARDNRGAHTFAKLAARR